MKLLTLFLLSTLLHAETIRVPKTEYPLADAKVRLIGLLLKSLHNQRDGIVDIRLEKQIQDLELTINTWQKTHNDAPAQWPVTGYAQ
jgi:hypothetical protein